jgi:predicted dehydrogenase
MLEHAQKAKRVFFPCHNYKHAPVVKAVKQVLESGLIGKVNLVTLHTFRNTHAKGVSEWRPDWRRERKYSGGGIAMDHGAHTFYLAFDWLGGYPTAITAKMSTTNAPDELRHGGQLLLHDDVPRGDRERAPHVDGRRAQGHLHDPGLARRHPRRGRRRRGGGHGLAKRQQPRRERGGAKKVSWELKKEQIASEWMDAGHSVWFRSLFEQFKTAIETKEYVGREAKDGLRCIELIATAYASAQDGCRELPLESERPATARLPLMLEPGPRLLRRGFLPLGLVALLYGVRVLVRGVAKFERVEKDKGSALFGASLMQMGYWALDFIGRGLSRMGATANGISIASLVLGIGAGVALACGHFGVGAAPRSGLGAG